MKQIAFTLFLITSLLCQGQSVEPEKGKKTATVIVEIPNAENYDLVLSVQGENFENRITQKIKKGRATFKVPYRHSDVALIEWQHNLENHQGNRVWIHILLEEETIIVQSKWESESMQVSETDYKPFYLFEDVVFKKSKMNQARYEAAYKLFDLNKVKGWINHTMLDSLSKFFFPQERKDAIQLFESEFYKFAPRVQAEMFHTMLDLMAFSPKYVSEDDRKAVNRIYSGFSNINPAWDYRFKILEYQLLRINNYGQEEKLSFTNFELLNLENESIVLKDLVQDNDYIVLYFWFAGCGPCRAFNEKINEKLINELKQNKIELISISTDFNKGSWQKASKQDAIFWRNLYGGHIKDDVEMAYRIKAYPTKVIFNKKLELVDFKFIRPEELLELVKNNK